MMDVAYITPFIGAVQNVFSTMLKLDVTVGVPARMDNSKNTLQFDVSSIIGLSGDVSGAVSLCFCREVSEKIINAFTNDEIEFGSEDFVDAIGELANMVTGSAKAQFPNEGTSISCPSVVIGAQHFMARLSDALMIGIPCECKHGTFILNVTIKQGASNTSSANEAATATVEAT